MSTNHRITKLSYKFNIEGVRCILEQKIAGEGFQTATFSIQRFRFEIPSETFVSRIRERAGGAFARWHLTQGKASEGRSSTSKLVDSSFEPKKISWSSLSDITRRHSISLVGKI